MVHFTSDRFLFEKQWDQIGVRHHHGVAFPLSSIYTEKSCGIGEILDLLSIIPWMKLCGFSIIQLLPLNDSGNDPSPYMAISAFALHPVYLSISTLEGISTLPSFSLFQREIEPLKNRSRVCYQSVLEKKITLMREFFLSSAGKALQKTDEYLQFIEEEQAWLFPYALFKSLKRENQNVAWWHFKKYRQRPLEAQSVLEKNKELSQEMQFWMGIQYLLFNQWKQVKAEAAAYQIQLMGDLPILVNRDSVDVWWNPELFSLDMSVGAPPDIYSKEGQIWGFPLYKWNIMRESKFRWFFDRLHLQEKLYDLYRIDHVVGLYRFWAIPPGKKATEGIFIPNNEAKWLSQGEEIVHIAAKATKMLPIGEDLGDIPDTIRSNLRELGIPSYKVIRWERDWKREGSPFLDPKTFSPESLVTVSTHDSSTLKGWWEEDRESAQRFCADMSIVWKESCTEEIRHTLLSLVHNAGSLFHINLLQEYLAFEPQFSWETSQFDRINIPGTISEYNWTWKCKVSIERLMNHSHLIEKIRSIVIT